MSKYDTEIDALFPELISETAKETKKDTAKLFGKDVGVSSLGSFFAGIGSGLFKVPEGFVSIGANLIDLGADTNTAEKVEKFFADINPFDEYAEATTAGKITEVLTNILIPVGAATKIANIATKRALAAKNSGNYFKLLDDACFFAVQSLVEDVFVLTTSFNINLIRPVNQGLIKAVGKLKYASKEIFVAEANLYNSEGKEIGFGTGNFTRSKIVLSE